MIDTVAKRRMTLNGKTYAKGEKVPMPLQQFQDLEPTGMVERAPVETAEPSAKRGKTTEPKTAHKVD